MFDWEEFFNELDYQRAFRRLSWRDVARQARVPASSLTRLKQGKTLSTNHVVAMLIWGGLKFDRFVVNTSVTHI